MHSASDSAIGLPSRSTRASLMLAFLIPADVRRSFMLPPGVRTAGGPSGAYGSVGVEIDRRPETHRLCPETLAQTRDQGNPDETIGLRPRTPEAERRGCVLDRAGASNCASRTIERGHFKVQTAETGRPRVMPRNWGT